jgi:DNA-binding response OmpR family regulator/Tfp pilus assembly protein PilF
LPTQLTQNLSDISVAIIDGDAVSAGLIDAALKEMGVRIVERFSDGASGWEAVRKGDFHLIILDWVVEQVSGLALFNRMRRSEKLSLTPVIVTTSALNKHDFALLGEYPCSVLVSKPLARSELVNSVKSIMNEYNSYRTNYELIDNLMNLIKYDGSNAEALFDKLWTRLPNPIPVAILAARMLRERNILDVAENILRKILEFNHKMIPIISELGKVLHMQGKLTEATRVLNHAQSFSPKNVERLLLLGEIHLQQTEPDSARQFFKAVMEIDPRDRKAYHGQVLAQSLSEHVAGNGGGEKLAQSFAGLLNILGITQIKNRKHANGIRQYEAAMSFVHSDGEAARLCFNIGLGYMRWGKPERALNWFTKCAMVDGPCLPRAQKYISEIEKKYGHRSSVSAARNSAESASTTSVPANSIESDLGMDADAPNSNMEISVVDAPKQDKSERVLATPDVDLMEAPPDFDDEEKIAV